MRRRRAAKNTAVRASLFPFLAVLLCTMGVLIVLLVVIARHSRIAAESVQDEVVPTVSLEDVAIEREQLALRIEQLQQQRAATESDLDARRLELGHLEDHARRLGREIEKLREAFLALETAAEDTNSQRLAAEVESLEQQVAEARADLEALAAESDQRSYAVVPYRGPNQTLRRPIYIECRDDALILQPEGVRLTEQDFRGPMTAANPLAAALRAAREYHMEQDAVARPNAEQSEPYPLLLVRTDGIYSYYVARAALKSWGSQFGYELLENDLELAFPAADPQLARVERDAIAEARLLQEQLARAAPRRYSSGERPVFRVAPGGGGLVRVDGGGPWQGDSSGGGSSPPRSPQSQPTAGNGSGGRDTNGSLVGTGGQSATLNDLAAVYGNAGTRQAEAATAAAGPQSPGSDGQSAPNGPSGETAFRGAAGGELPFPEAGATADAYGSGGGSLASTSGPSSNESIGQFHPQGAEGGDQAIGNTSGTAGGSPQAGPSASDGTASQAMSGSAGSSGTAAGAPNPTITSAGRRPHQGPPPESLANSRGTNWGLPGNNQGAVALTRPIRIELRADRLVFWSDDRPSRPVRQVALNGPTEDAVDELVAAVWKEMQSWGIAGRGLYWRPTLSFHVHPNAAWRYQELAVLLSDSGLDTKYRMLRPATARLPAAGPRR